jgi:hypothetical protein
MSARASAYAKTLVVCPNGERLSRGEKLVLIVLADNHQDKAKHFTYPAVETLAEDALCDRRTCQRHLAALDRKGVIRRMRPPNQGRGTMVFYFFTELDAIPEGWQNAALPDAGLFVVKGGKRAAEGRQKGGKSCTPSMTNTNKELELKATPPNPLAGEGERVFDLAVDQVCSALAISNRRKRRLLRDVIALEATKGDLPATIALAMIAAWNAQAVNGRFLRAKFGLARFFGEGIWKDSGRWHWDQEALRDESRARVGSR